MANQWFKFYGGEFLSDPKMERLSPIERSCWITLLCMASMGVDGMIEFLTVESLLNRSGIQFDPYHPEEWEKALAVLMKFKSLKMIDTFEDGRILIINWEKRQEHNLTVAERVAKSRRNKRVVTTNVTNVTIEKSRVEEKREDTLGAVSSIKYLSSIPEIDMKEFVARFDVSPSKVRSIGEDLVLYCQRKGKVYKNYKAFLLNALKRNCKERPAPKPAPAPEKPLTPEERERQAKKIKEIGDQVRGLAAAKKI